jgi:DNA polymerase-3 subunit epsilon
VETAGELGAALAELKTLRESAPSHMNPHDKVLWSIALDDAGGWLQPRITEFDAAEPLRFGAFRRERDGNKALEQIVKAHRLCRKMLGLEQAEGSCVGHQLGHCRGACVGKESSILHNARIQLALSGLKLKEALPRPSRGARAFVDRVG